MGTEGRRRAAAAIAVALAAMHSAAPDVARAQTAGLARPGTTIEQLRRAAEAEPQPLAGAPRIPLTSQTPPANADEIRFVLTGVELSGGTVYAPGDLSDIYGDRIGREIRLTELFSIAAAIQARYRADGYLFNRVIVPAQEIAGGKVRLEMLEAVIESVSVEEPAGPIGPVKALAEAIAAPLSGLRNPRLEQIEGVLLRLSDIPGIARAAAVPKLGSGEERGAVRLFINMERAPRDIVFFADNRQAPLAGRGLYGVVAAFNAWSAAADTTTLSLFGSADFDDEFPEDFKERWTVQLEHQRHLGAGGTKLYARALYSETRPGAEVKDFEITGSQFEAEFGVETPLHLTRALSIRGLIGVEIAEMDGLVPGAGGAEDLVTADDSIRAVKAGLSVTQRDAFGALEFEGELRAGLPILGASAEGQEGLSRADGSASYALARGRLSRTFAFPELGPISFWAELSGQWADRPLLAFEEFSIGGPGIGRAFDPSEFSGDIGYGAAGEIRYATSFDLEAQRIDATFYMFGDLGRIRNLDGGEPLSGVVSSWGFGVRSALPWGVSLNLEAAKPINARLQRTESDRWRFFFSASKRF